MTGPFLMGTPFVGHRMRMERLLESLTPVLRMLLKKFHCEEAKQKPLETRGLTSPDSVRLMLSQLRCTPVYNRLYLSLAFSSIPKRELIQFLFIGLFARVISSSHHDRPCSVLGLPTLAHIVHPSRVSERTLIYLIFYLFSFYIY